MDVKIHFDHEYRVEDTTDIGTIKILMLKGEKGDSGGGGGSGAVFVTYDTSTFEEIDTAYNDGKMVYAVSGDYAYPLTMFDGDNAEFSGYSSEGCVTITCDSTDAWAKLVTSYMADVTFAQRGQFLRYNGLNWSAHMPTKSDVNLGNVDNTSDAAKPISNATQTALDGKITAPSSPTAGQFLVYNGTAWVAQTVPNASGVSF